MKKIISNIFILLAVVMFTNCYNNPIDEDNLLITNRDEWYVSNFDLTGTDHLTVKVGDAVIDNENCTINITVLYGTDLKHLYPKFSLVTDAKLSPKIEGITDFSDLEHPRQYTVISGSRRVKKTYTIYITVQERKG